MPLVDVTMPLPFLRWEALLKSDDLSIEMVPMIKAQIARLKKPVEGKPGAKPVPEMPAEESAEAAARSSPPSNGSRNSSTCSRK